MAEIQRAAIKKVNNSGRKTCLRQQQMTFFSLVLSEYIFKRLEIMKTESIGFSLNATDLIITSAIKQFYQVPSRTISIIG